MDLYKDVIELLSDNDCVIIPEFGGFVTNYVAARVNISTQEFFPPLRLVAFNENLKSNDGLLINYLSANRGVSWMVAEDYVCQFVDTINKLLNVGETVNFDNLGKFTRKDGCLVFHPANTSLESNYYGLSSFYFPMLKSESSLNVKPPMIISNRKATKKSYAGIIYASSIAAVLGGLAFLSFQYGLFDFNSNNIEYAKIIPIELPSFNPINLENLNPEDKTDKTADFLMEVDAINDEASIIKEDTVILQNPITESSEPLPFDHVGKFVPGKSYIIAGCFSTFENAVNLKKSLIQNGFPSELFKMKSGLVGVSVKSYPNFKLASAELKTLKSEIGNSSLWIYN